jgi:hypothetical protein
MSLIRRNWPIILIATLSLLAIGAGDGHASRSVDSEASVFATRHYLHCMQSRPDQANCALRTIQLASQLGGMDFGDRVAAELR